MNEPNLAALRQQWLDLKALHAQGALDAPAYEAARLALEQRIVACALAAEPAAPPAASSRYSSETGSSNHHSSRSRVCTPVS